MSGVKGKSGGHNRATNNEKIKLGVRKSRINADAPETIKGEMITWEDMGEHGKKIREKFMLMLQNNGTLSITDSLVMHKFCRVAEDWFKYDKMCIEKGRILPVKDMTGQVVGFNEAAWSLIETKLRAGLDSLRRELGLSPTTRDSIKKIAVNKPINRWTIK